MEKTKKKRRRTIIKRVLIAVLVVAIVIGVGASGYFIYRVYQETDGLDISKLTSNESTTLYDENGDEIVSLNSSDAIAKYISYDELPQVLIDAVISAEDSRYFVHDGFDLPRIVKSFMGNIVAGEITAGGSTITQQLIKKSYYPEEQQTMERKVGEVILAIQATKELSKEKVLELYLNKIYFGNGPKTVGIYAACMYYFNKSVQNITLPEAALLAGCINSPTTYDPFNNLDKAQNRRDIILDLMCTHGYITEAERDTAKAVPVQNILKNNPVTYGGQYQDYTDMVTREAVLKTGMDPYTVGMRIYTYMDPDIQNYLDDIGSGKSYTFPDEYIDIGAVVQETQTGRVVGVLSGRNYTALGTTNAYAASKELAENNVDYNYGQRHQPGSSLKPIISYASAFEYLDYSTAHYVHDEPYSSGNWNPKNVDNKVHGDVSIEEALYNSWNLAAINTLNEVIDEVGTDELTKYLEGFGFDMYEEDFGPVYAIGGWYTGVTPQEIADAFATIANGGTYIESHTIQKIEIISTGEVIYIDKEAQQDKTTAISEESAFMIKEVMTGYVKESKGQYGSFNLGYQIGAKSGSTDDYKDRWMSGYSPDYAWSVWVGYDGDAHKKGYSANGTDARDISAMIAKYIHQGGLVNTYKGTPSGVVEDSCIKGVYPYASPTSSTPSSRIVKGWFKKNNTPQKSNITFDLAKLESFTASLNDDKILVEFSEYPSGDDYSASDIVYMVEVQDSSGKSVATEKLTSNTGTLSFTPTTGEYTVIGYYQLKDSSTTSNKISQTISMGATFDGSFSIKDKTKNSVSVSVKVNTSDNYIMLGIYNSSGSLLKEQKVTSNQTVTFSGLNAGTSYSLKATEYSSNGESNDLGSKSFTTEAEPVKEDTKTEQKEETTETPKKDETTEDNPQTQQSTDESQPKTNSVKPSDGEEVNEE